MMKKTRLLLISVLTFLCGMSASASGPAIRDIRIDVKIRQDGSAAVSERWDITATRGTEWYLVRNNLGDIVISDFRVMEGDRLFEDVGAWDVDASLARKAGKSGINKTGSGVELCWGLGSYGDHVFEVSYVMQRAAKSLSDYDMFHVQLVSPGLSSQPEHVSATLSVEGAQISTENARIWGFGYVGQSAFSDGSAVFTSSEAFSHDSSMIVLLRLDKGLISPVSVQDRSFETVLERAMEGASFDEDDEIDAIFETIGKILLALLGYLCILRPILVAFGLVSGINKPSKRKKKKLLGVENLKDVSWHRDIPFEGSVLATASALEKLGEGGKRSDIASALILRMINEGFLSVGKDAKGKVELTINQEKDRSGLHSESEQSLYDMIEKASGSDKILQNKEFSRYASRNGSKMMHWVEKVKNDGILELKNRGWMALSGKEFTTEGQARLREALGFKMFLKEFTLIKERASAETVLWKDYLVFAAIFGIADKVAKELKEIDPAKFAEFVGQQYNGTSLNDVIFISNRMGNNISTAQVSSSGSSSGFGGTSSFGGGGGFSGGGFGGGCR